MNTLLHTAADALDTVVPVINRISADGGLAAWTMFCIAGVLGLMIISTSGPVID